MAKGVAVFLLFVICYLLLFPFFSDAARMPPSREFCARSLNNIYRFGGIGIFTYLCTSKSEK
jgi:hypothetical protein